MECPEELKNQIVIILRMSLLVVQYKMRTNEAHENPIKCFESYRRLLRT